MPTKNGLRLQSVRPLRRNRAYIQAADLSPEQLAATVAEKLRKFVNEPQVTVIVTAINSQRVFVVGEVLRAGAFPRVTHSSISAACRSATG